MILENNGLKIIIGKNVPETDAPIIAQETEDPRALVHEICLTITEGGFNPVSQLVGYIESDDPTHIPNYKNARTMINRIDRDELIKDMVKTYIEHLESIYGKIDSISEDNNENEEDGKDDDN